MLEVPKLLSKCPRKEGFSDCSWKGLSPVSPSTVQVPKQGVPNGKVT